MPRKAADSADGSRPILPFRPPEKTKAIPAKTEIKESTFATAEEYVKWANEVEPDSNVTLATLIELALEDVFRRDKGFQKRLHGKPSDGAGQPPARTRTAAGSAAADSNK